MLKIGLILGAGLLAILVLAGAQSLYARFGSDLAEAHKAHLSGNAELAIERSTAAIASPFLLPSQKADAYRLRGVVHWRLKEEEKALLDLSASLAIAPEARTYRLRSFLFEQAGRYDDAIADLTSQLLLEPSDLSAYLARADLHATHLNHAAAIEDFGIIIERQPSFRAQLAPRRAMAYADLGEVDKAIGEIDAISLSSSYDHEGHLRRGHNFDNVAAHDRARQEFDAAIRLQPRNAEVYFARGISRVAAGDFEGALRDLDTAISLDPQESLAHYGRGRANYHLGRTDMAKKDIEAALATYPTYMYPALWLHLTHLRAGGPQPSLLQSYAGAFGEYWPRPIFDHFAGTLDREALFEKAAEGPPSVQREQLCEVQFFLGAALAARGDRDAKKPLEKAREICPRAFVEYSSAQHELKRLAP